MEKFKEQLITGLVSLLVSLFIVFITLRSDAWARKADKSEVYRIEQEIKKDVNKLENALIDHLKDDNEFKKNLDIKLDDHQKQIIEIIKTSRWELHGKK